MSDTQDPPQLYAAHEPIFPRRVKGTFRTLKWWLMGFMLGVYYITPWLRWDRVTPSSLGQCWYALGTKQALIERF